MTADRDIAQARRHAYQLLGRLWREGLTADLFPYAAALPALAAALPDPFDADQAAAAHQALFGLDIYPYESVFRDPSGLLGGDVSAAGRASYDAAGFQPVDEADHIGEQLTFVAHLVEGQGEAVLGAFLGERVLSWLPPLVTAVAEREEAFYTAVAQLTVAVVGDQAADLAAAGRLPRAGATLPDAPDILDATQSGLKEIAGWLTTPPYSGWYLGPSAIGALARAHGLPRGFGGRRARLTTLLRTAVQYEALPALLAALAARRRQWADRYQALADEAPALAPFIAPWAAALDVTKDVLERLAAATRAPAG